MRVFEAQSGTGIGPGWGSRLGLGAYPDQSYYDPKRPSWLPYWIDTPSENFLKWGFYPDVTTLKDSPPVPGAAPPGAPITLDQMTVPGEWTPADSAQASYVASAKAWADYFTATDDAEKQRQKERDSSLNWLQIITGVAFVVGGLVAFDFLEGLKK